MNQESDQGKKRNKFVYWLDVVLLITLLCFVVYAKVDGYYNKTYMMVNICDKPAQIVESNDREYRNFEKQIQYARVDMNVNPDKDNTFFMENLTW